MLPLSGITVVELGVNFAGPFCTTILGHLGAEVIKIERPGDGDDARAWGPPFLHGSGAAFNAINLNKKSVTVDLKDPDQRDWLLQLISTADVFLQNLRPGVVEELGLDGPKLRQKFPQLIYCSLSAYGAKGPLKDRPGYEPILQAFSGLMMLSGYEGGPPTRMGTQMLDNGTGMWSAIGILAALWQRQTTGEGCLVGTSLLETALGWLTVPQAGFATTGKLPQRHPTGSPRVVPFEAVATSDGPILVAAANDRLFAKLATALGHGEWADNPNYKTNADRAANKPALMAEIAAVMSKNTCDHWQGVLAEAGVPNSPIHTFDETLRHPHIAALGMLQQAPGLEEPVSFISLPISFDGKRPKSAPWRRKMAPIRRKSADNWSYNLSPAND